MEKRSTIWRRMITGGNPSISGRKFSAQSQISLNVSLTGEDLARIDEGAPRDAFAGLRYPQSTMEAVNR